MRCPRCQHENRPQAKFCEECASPFNGASPAAPSYAELKTEVERIGGALTEALEQQTATSEILRVLSQFPTDVQPVFDTIGERARRLCEADVSGISHFDGEALQLVALHGVTQEGEDAARAVFPMRPDAETIAARAFRAAAVVHVADVLADPAYEVKEAARAGRFRGCLGVPMLREGRVVGVIFVARTEPGLFADTQIDLLKTFADQAVIAIENVRLFQELQARTGELTRSVEQLTALSEVGRAVSSTLDLPTVLATIVARAVQLSGTSGGVIYEYEEATQTFHLTASHQTEAEVITALRAVPIQLGEGATGQAALRQIPVEIADLLEDRQYQFERVRSILTRLGYRSVLSIPLLLEQRVQGALTVSRREPGSFRPETVNLLQTFATQSALAIQNARLFREIAEKSRELEAASRHKSEFLANMSHELRTPLNAILGFSEVLAERMFGEVNEKQAEYLQDILSSGRHLLSLIRPLGDTRYFASGWDFAEEHARLRMLEEIYDPETTRRLSNIGVTDGWRCLELGAGAGSIARWLAERVGLAGQVVAADIDTRFLQDLDRSNVEVRQLDIRTTDLGTP